MCEKEKIADFQQIVGRGWEHIRPSTVRSSHYSGTDGEYRVRWYAFIKIECVQSTTIEVTSQLMPLTQLLCSLSSSSIVGTLPCTL